MGTGFRGTFVISWSQTEIDGLEHPSMEMLTVGATWTWGGQPVRVDGPSEVLQLDLADGEADLRKRAARKVRKLVGAAVQNTTDVGSVVVDDPLMDQSFIVTNGTQSFVVTVIEPGTGAPPLLMFMDEMPPQNTDLWVVQHSFGIAQRPNSDQTKGGVICFTPGTWINTPHGVRQVQDLREGDLVQTRDNGAQPIEWIGSRRMTGARFFVMPHLRPVRIRPGALGIERPEGELLVSPEHRLLVRGAAARDLFNTDEVLVAARHLVNGRNVGVDTTIKEVTYIHLLLPDHQILWANNVETESFHPASADFSTLKDEDRMRLLVRKPELEHNPFSYGDMARRTLSDSEAAILMHEAA